MEEEAATCPICLDDIQVIQNVNGECVGGEEGERSVVKCMVNQQEQSAWRMYGMPFTVARQK